MLIEDSFENRFFFRERRTISAKEIMILGSNPHHKTIGFLVTSCFNGYVHVKQGLFNFFLASIQKNIF